MMLGHLASRLLVLVSPLIQQPEHVFVLLALVS
jgi:hypothetical protein